MVKDIFVIGGFFNPRVCLLADFVRNGKRRSGKRT
jgi:hypothetical protein